MVWYRGGLFYKGKDGRDALGLRPVGGVELEEPPDERGEAGPVHGGEGVVGSLHHGLAEVLDAVGMVWVGVCDVWSLGERAFDCT